MRRAARLAAAALLAAAPAAAAAPSAPAEALRDAAEGLARGENDRARLAALGRAAAAQEAALAELRAELRALFGERERLQEALTARGGAAFAALSALDRLRRLTPAALMAHPDGPLAAARAGSLLAGVAPRLDAEAARARAALEALRAVEARRARLAAALHGAAEALATARARIETATAEGGGLGAPLLAAAASLDAVAEAAGPSAPVAARGPAPNFAAAAGDLPPPVRGRVARRFGEPGPDGRARGVTVEAEPWAMVYAPWLSSVRFAGRAPGVGLVVALEPARGALILLAGLGELAVQAGDIVPAGAAVGALSRAGPAAEAARAAADFPVDGAASDSTISPTSLYIETRRDGRPIDPAEWFAFTTERTTG